MQYRIYHTAQGFRPEYLLNEFWIPLSDFHSLKDVKLILIHMKITRIILESNFRKLHTTKYITVEE